LSARSGTQRSRCAIVPRLSIAAEVSPTLTPIAVTIPGEHLHSSMIGTIAIAAPKPPRALPSPSLVGASASPLAIAMRRSKASRCIEPMPNVV